MNVSRRKWSTLTVLTAAAGLALLLPQAEVAAAGNRGTGAIIVFDYAGGNPVPDARKPNENPFHEHQSNPSWALWTPDGKKHSLEYGLGDAGTFNVQVRNANSLKYQIGVAVATENLYRTPPDSLKTLGLPIVTPTAGARMAVMNLTTAEPARQVVEIADAISRIRLFADQVRKTVLAVDTEDQRVAAKAAVNTSLKDTLVYVIERVEAIGEKPVTEDVTRPGALLDLTNQLLALLPRLRPQLQGAGNQQALDLLNQLEQQSAENAIQRKSVGGSGAHRNQYQLPDLELRSLPGYG